MSHLVMAVPNYYFIFTWCLSDNNENQEMIIFKVFDY